LISILTTTLNCASTIQETLASVRVLADFVPVQHLLLDAGSTDGTWDFIQAHAKNEGVRAYCVPGLNIPNALNKLIAEACGTHIIILNGDDFLEPDVVADFFAIAGSSKEDVILCGDVKVLSTDGTVLGMRSCRIEKIDKYMSLNHPAMLIPKIVYHRVGKFNGECLVSFDYEWVWRAYQSGIHFRYIPKTVATVRMGGLSSKRAVKAAYEIMRFKASAGYIPQAVREYLWFQIKRAVRYSVPKPLLSKLIKSVRKRTGSVDQYSEFIF